MDRRVNIRRRIVITAIFSTVFFVFLTSPFVRVVGDLASSPPDVFNVRAEYFDNNVELSWEAESVSDLNNYKVKVEGGADKEIDPSVNAYTFQLENITGDVTIAIISVDIFGNESDGVALNIPYSESIAGELLSNEVDTSLDESAERVLLKSFAITGFLFVLSLWIFSVKPGDLKRVKLLNVVAYPALTTLPIILLVVAYLESESNSLGQFGISLLAMILFYIVLYFILLTTNILYNALSYELPLEQAAKAAQFIFSLISAYVVLILFVGSELAILEKLVFIAPFMFYYSFASILLLKDITTYNAVIRALSVAITIVGAIAVLSMWPINYIYILLTVAVIFYILLSVALETKKEISRYVVLEYSILVFLISLILLINSSWGIQGTLL